MNLYEQRQWQIKEHHFFPHTLPHSETVMTIGNGLVGVRGTFEEGYPGDSSATLVAGIFNQQGDSVPELVAMPDWFTLRVSVNGEMCRLDQGTILGFERVLDMKTAMLRRGVLWLSPQRTVLRLAFERFASLDNPHVLALRVLIQVLSEGQHTVEVYSALDGSVKNPSWIDPAGTDHWAELVGYTEGDSLYINGETNQSRYRMAMASQLHIEGATPQWREVSTPRIPAHTATFEVEANQKVVVTKLVSLHTSRDSDDPVSASRATLQAASTAGYDVLRTAHEAAWSRRWDAFDIQIEGDETAQRAVRFCTYHMLIAAPVHEDRVSIGAKTLSGFGYKGHAFWDTEVFIVPPLTLGSPDLARNLLMYRYHNLAGARAKAEEAGYEGAMYPWESTDTGEETTPRWGNNIDSSGERIRIWTGDNEQHISTDITYAVLQHWRWTGDDEWFVRYGAEIVLDTAKFWGSRAEYDADQGRYELNMQIGPDEYHENVNNSVFTNRMAVWHLEQALAVWEWLKAHHSDAGHQLAKELNITAVDIDKWHDVAAKMWIPMSDEGGGVFEQFEDFFERLQPINLEDYTPRTSNMDWILGHEKTQVARVIKQADVVMLMALLGDELGDEAFLRRNWDMYAELCDQGSSLSPAVHAWVAARLGLAEIAYEYFIYAATIDLENHKGNVHDGIHAANCGGVWQAVAFGFCGLERTSEGLKTNPCLPDHWQRVRFNVHYNGQLIPIDIQQGE